MKLLVLFLSLASFARQYSFDMNWTDTNPPGVTERFLMLRADEECKLRPPPVAFKQVGETTSTRFIDNTVANGGGYCFSVVSVTAAGVSPRSQTLSVKIPKR